MVNDIYDFAHYIYGDFKVGATPVEIKFEGISFIEK